MMFADDNASVASDERGINDVYLVFGDGFSETTDQGCEEGFGVDFGDVALENEVKMVALGGIMLGVEIAYLFHEVDIGSKTFEFFGENYRGIDSRGGELALKNGENLLTNVLGD